MKTSASSPSNNRLIRCLGLIPMITVPCALANDTAPWQLHGFLAQAAFHSSDNNFYGNSDDDLSGDFNEAGLNASVRLFDGVRLAGQVLARNAGATDNGALRTDYFNLDWRFWRHATAKVGARVGRVRNPYGLYNETRDVAHTRPSINVPAVVYMEQARDVMISRDGFALYGEIYGDAGTFMLEGGAGEVRVSDQLIAESLLADIPGIEPEAPELKIARAQWESPAARWRLALSVVDMKNDVEYLLAPGTFDLQAHLLSLQYSSARWQLTAEYLRFDYEFDFGFFARAYPGEAAYLQYSWMFSSAWQLYGRYEYGVWDRHHRNGSSMQQFCGTVFEQFCYPRHLGYRHDSGIGVRWDIDQHWMVAAEAHYIEGTMMLAYSDNRATADTAAYWTLLGLEAAFRF